MSAKASIPVNLRQHLDELSAVGIDQGCAVALRPIGDDPNRESIRRRKGSN